MSEVGFVTMGKASGGEEVKPIGIGMLGYAFMGKAHSNAYKTLAYMTWPPPLHAAARGDRRPQRGGGLRGRAPLRVRRVQDGLEGADRRRPDPAVRQRGPEQPARGADDRGRRGGQARDLREAARPRRRRVLRDLAARAGRRRQAHVRVQLPLRAGRAARAPDHLLRRAGRPAALPRRVPAGVGHHRGRHLALPEGPRRLRLARRPRRARDRPLALPGRRDRRGVGDHADVHPRPRRRRRGRGGRALRERRGRHDRGVAVLPGPQERLHVGDQRLQGLARRSTSSA